ncbi:hypothetical protein Trydic_g17655 [Trypoxylus dichotomus]
MITVAPSRASSRMQQQFEEGANGEESVRNVKNDPITNGGGVEDADDDHAGAATPRNDKIANPISTPATAGTTAVVLAKNTESDDEEYEERELSQRVNHAPNGGGGGGGGSYWRHHPVPASRPTSPGATTMADNASDASSMMPPARPKSRVELATSRYSNLSYWRARRVTFYKNGDPFFPGLEFRFKPGRDIYSLETLLDKLSLRMDLPRGARYIFSMDGDRKFRLDELEDGASYVVSSYKTFKVRNMNAF